MLHRLIFRLSNVVYTGDCHELSIIRIFSAYERSESITGFHLAYHLRSMLLLFTVLFYGSCQQQQITLKHVFLRVKFLSLTWWPSKKFLRVHLRLTQVHLRFTQVQVQLRFTQVHLRFITDRFQRRAVQEEHISAARGIGSWPVTSAVGVTSNFTTALTPYPAPSGKTTLSWSCQWAMVRDRVLCRSAWSLLGWLLLKAAMSRFREPCVSACCAKLIPSKE